MKQDRKVDADKIHILSIKTLQGNIDTSEGAEASGGRYEFGFELQTAVNYEDNIVGIKLKIEIQGLDEEDKFIDAKGSYTHEVLMKVENLDDFVEKADKPENNTIDGTLASTLVAIVVSTVRGMIYQRTQGTALGAVILPVIDPRKLLVSTERTVEA